MVDNLIIALRRFCFTFVCMSLMGLPVHSAAEIDARAQEVLKRMNDYVSGLEQFTIRATTTTDDMTASGEKLQFGAAIDIQVRRPDRVRVDVNGDIQKQQLVYDGKTITLLNSDLNYYATLHAPPTIDAAMNHAADNFALNAPLADFLFSNSYDVLMENVTSGRYVGLHDIFGIQTHHLAFRQDDIDWQIWIENSDTPLPRKMIISRKRVAAAPQFTALLSDWDVSARLQDGVFVFEVPEHAVKIDFLPADRAPVPQE